MNNLFNHIILFTIISFLSTGVWAQIDHPKISPPATLVQKIGLSEVKIEYSRPSVNKRKIMGELVPYGRIWRVGANESTKIHFSDSVKIQGHDLPPGIYAVYSIPQKNEWTIIIHKNISHWGDGRFNYKQEEDALRFQVEPQSINFAETFTIELDEITHKSAILFWEWENTRIQFLLEFDTQKKMLKEIETKVLKNPTADTYYESARYLQEEGIMTELALDYLLKAHNLVGDKYYIHRIWALVEAQLGNYDQAILHAQISKGLAEKERKDEFVRMNEKSIEEWKLKL